MEHLIIMPEKKLKIAVCFFGHLRSYEKCSQALKRNLLQYYDYDLFMHTWATIDHNTPTWHNFKMEEGGTDRDKIINSYGSLKSIKIEEQYPKDIGSIIIKSSNTDKEKQISLFGMRALFHSMRQSLKECEDYAQNNQVSYDYILFIRPDIWLKTPFKIDHILKKVSSSEIKNSFFTFAYPAGQVSNSDFKNLGGVDLCFFATPETMVDIIANNELALSHLQSNMIIDHGPELYLTQFVKDRGFTPYRVESFIVNRDWEILRSKQAIKIRRRIISLRVGKRKFLLRIFPLIMYQILSIHFKLFGLFTIYLSIGHTSAEFNDH